MLASIVLNVMNEEKNIADLLDSLVVQEGPIEIIVVDAASKDRTRDVVKSYVDRYPFVTLHVKPGRRGESTNYGVSLAKGDFIMFTGGTCIANPFWVKEMRSAVKAGANVVVGRTINIGYQPWESLDRVELYHKGNDISYPSCNEAFSREAITKAGGFDSWFITAEDIDLNLRAVDAGFDIVYDTNAVIYHRTKATV
jgi:cellulose synthase/poly-beta-1,6-N-acetylglucosamine synthase-like glycosyltransferase